VGQIVLEHLLLALAGGLGGLALAWGAISIAPSILPESLPRQGEISLDRLDPVSFVGFPLALVVVAAAANFFPARAAAAIDPVETLRSE
jgi:ABC-type antimicrobial peptide transport system permease subunit